MINETVLNNSTTDIQTWTGIPATYTHLLIVAIGRLTETSKQSDTLALQINGDTGAYYSYLQMLSNNATGTLSAPFAVSGYAGTSAPLGVMTASEAGAAANAGAIVAWIPWYTSTTFNKVVLSLTGAGNGTTAYIDGRLFYDFYNPVTQAAVSSLSISAPAGSDFKAGTSFGLYGLS